ncbi:MAG: ATP-binding protein [Candidatus Sumerlaeota bacterium]|nr:ATP-binding protein [Candidatus Sumerlaeota bacterium]
MSIDMSTGLKMKLDEAQKRAQKFYEAGDVDRAAEEYRRCARIMKELVKSAISAETQKARLEKAKQYLELAKQIEDGRAVAVTNEERKARAEARRTARPAKSQPPSDGETETEEDALVAQVAELIVKSPVTWGDIAGLDQTKREIQAAYALAMAAPPRGVKVKSNRNILFYGPPGTGKTLLAAAASNGLDATFFNVKVSSLLSKYFGESSRLVTALFEEGRRRAPSLVFFDEIESLVSSRDGAGSGGPEKRILSTFLSELDGLAQKKSAEFLLTIAATNTPWALDEAILSRFGKLVYVPLPDPETRAGIFDLLLDDCGYEYEVSGADLIERSKGYSGRDIEKVCTEAIEIMLADANSAVIEAAGKGAAALREEQLKVRPIRAMEFVAAFKKIRPKTSADAVRRYEDWATGIEA